MSQTFFPHHGDGHEANALGKRSFDYKKKKEEVKKKVDEFIKRHENEFQLSNQFFLFSMAMTACWLLTCFVEYMISQPMYVEMVGLKNQGIPPIALILFAILPSALMAEPYFRLFSRAFNSGQSPKSVRDTIINRDRKDLPITWLLFTIGLLMAVLLVLAMYYFSETRIEMMQAARIQVESMYIQLYLPSLLLALEIVTGIFVPNAIYCAVHVYPHSKYLLWRARRYEEKSRELALKACELWDAYRRELDKYNDENDKNETSVAISEELRQIILELFHNKDTNREDDAEEVDVEDPDPPNPVSPPGNSNEPPEVSEDVDDSSDEDQQDLKRVLDSLTEENNKNL